MPFKNGELDLIISGLLEHAYDINKSMKEIVLNKDGILFARWRSDKIWGSPYEFYNHNHYRFFTRKTWELLLHKFNFKLINFTYEEIEGLTGAAYIIAKKSDSNNDKFEQSNLVKFNSKIDQK